MTLDTVPGFISIGVDDGPRAPSYGKSYREQKESQGYNFARENDLHDESCCDSILHKEITIGEEHHHSNEIQISRSMDQYDRRIDNNAHSNRRNSGDNRPQQHSEPRRTSFPPKNTDRLSTAGVHTPPRRRQPRRSSMGSKHQSHGDIANRHHHAEHNDNYNNNHGNTHNATWDRHEGEQQQRGHDPRRQAKSSPPRQRRRSTMGHSTKYYPPAEHNENQHHGNNHNAEWNGEQQHDSNNAPPRRRQQRRRSNESQKYNPRPEPMPRPPSVDHHLERQQQSSDRIKRPSRMKSMEQPRRADARRSPQRRRNTMGTTAATTNREASTSSPSFPDSNNKQGLLTGMKYAVDPMERLNPMARKLMEARKLRKARQNFG